MLPCSIQVNLDIILPVGIISIIDHLEDLRSISEIMDLSVTYQIAVLLQAFSNYRDLDPSIFFMPT